MTREIALEHKAKGNAFFTAKDFNPAIDEFTKAIENDPTDHVLEQKLINQLNNFEKKKQIR